MQCVCAMFLYFSTLSHKLLFRKQKVTEHKMYVLTFSTNFFCKVSHTKKNSATYCTTTLLFNITQLTTDKGQSNKAITAYGVGGLRHAPAATPPGKTRHPLYRRLGAPQGRFRPVQKISPAAGFDSRTFQPVASRYTD